MKRKEREKWKEIKEGKKGRERQKDKKKKARMGGIGKEEEKALAETTMPSLLPGKKHF